MIDVVVAVVLHNSAALVPDLLATLEGPGLAGVGSWHLVVADSGSEDGGLDVVRDEFPEATTISLGANRGYGAGINAAVRVAPAHEVVLVMNPDVRLLPGCVAAMVRRARAVAAPWEHEGVVGIVVPRLLDPDGRVAPSLRRTPTLGRAAGEALLGGHRAGRFDRLGETIVDPAAYERARVADWATGALWAVTAECFHALGGFDPTYFLYSEETDFGLRARDAGYLTVYEPRAAAVHAGGASNTDPDLYALLTWNRYRCYRSRHGAGKALAFRGALLAGEAARTLTGRSTARAAARALLGSHPSVRRSAGEGAAGAAPGSRVGTADGVRLLTTDADQESPAPRDASRIRTSGRSGNA